MASINVKIPTATVRDALIEKAEHMRKQIEATRVAKETYEREIERFQEQVRINVVTAGLLGDIAPSNIEVSVAAGWHSARAAGTTDVFIRLIAPDTVVPQKQEIFERYDMYELDQLDSAIRLLTMTTDTTVSASTFKAVSKYL
jgi:hypothetical protein